MKHDVKPAPAEPSASPPSVMTPREIVSELDRYIVGQKDAKRAVAIALRNRWRRQLVPEDLREEIAPKNIIMIGPTGVGKTEISRRLAKLAQAPFIKVEASKFTEVGYVGRDVESIIRDLTDLAVNMVKEEEKQKVEIRAREIAEEHILDLLLPPTQGSVPDGEAVDAARLQGTRDKLKKMLREGKMDDRFVDIELSQSAMPMIEVLAPQGMEGMEFNLKEMFSNLLPKKTKKKTVKIPAGAADGTKIRVAGEGDTGFAGGPQGDLYLVVTVKVHPDFERHDDDLYTDLKVSLFTAVLGGEVYVNTLSGSVKLRIPPGTQSGKTIRISERGMPNLRQADRKGDLYARVLVQVPTNLTEEERELFERLSELHRGRD